MQFRVCGVWINLEVIGVPGGQWAGSPDALVFLNTPHWVGREKAPGMHTGSPKNPRSLGAHFQFYVCTGT